MTCKSIDLDGFGSAVDDAWFDQYTIPIDGEEETGVYPYQAAALKARLQAIRTATALTKLYNSEKKTDLRDRIVGILEDVLFKLPESYIPALVDLLKELS
ncbi:hypothetical protein N7491_011320 [Penicillium cf. griseofulvum]|uniref:Uncharacterized protein n=1 Tax=Penicillium cf. griseofulvum TaxID=2972120 RepID=A0A9W9JN98_9EURO|nr:hypothetical protein N7472_004678 [Penicillium cf. griseofulvum]KAJ5416418.1 hypothetical protein N7491_011320 [Penicillium cf. griseofulvum]KAJ5442244.1 hypothetical protein N7445_005251 [Penicillium cf. griseofulvum]